MKQYKVTRPTVVFSVRHSAFGDKPKEFTCKEGDVIELPEDHVTTRALLERKRIVEVQVDKQKKPSNPAPETQEPAPEEQSAHKDGKKKT